LEQQIRQTKTMVSTYVDFHLKPFTQEIEEYIMQNKYSCEKG